MPRRDRLVLRAFSVWSFFVWGVLIRNMLKDHTHAVSFRVVHIVLAVISLSFAVATWAIAGRRRAEPQRWIDPVVTTSKSEAGTRFS